MASRPKQADPRPAPRLYLVTPPVADAQAFSATLAAALGAGDVAAVLLRLAEADERTQINRAKTLVPSRAGQGRGAAHRRPCRSGGARRRRRRACAPASTVSSDAVEQLKPERIVGVGGLVTRHDAMTAAEAGADYVMFGEPGADGERPGFDGDRRARRLVGGSVRSAVRRLCRLARRGARRW